MDTISITTKLSFNDYLKVNYYLLYRTLYLKFLALLGIFCFVVPISKYLEGNPFNYISFGFGTLMILIPIFLYFTLKKSYHNTRISETIIYNINDETIQCKGATFDSTFTWDKIYKVSETRNWIFIWQTKHITNIIPKKDFTSDELNLLRTIVKSHKEVKNKMK